MMTVDIRPIRVITFLVILLTIVSLSSILIYKHYKSKSTEYVPTKATVESALVTPIENLYGPLPIGRWACFHIKDFNKNYKTNKPAPITRCDINWRMFNSKIIEFQEASLGYILLVDKHNINSESFKLENSPFSYLRNKELRWMLYANADNFSLVLQTDSEYHTVIEIISNNIFHKLNRDYEYIIRIGSPEYILLMNYKECIEMNSGRNIYKLQDCGIPWN